MNEFIVENKTGCVGESEKKASRSGIVIAALVCAILSPFTCGSTYVPSLVLAILALCIGTPEQRKVDKGMAIWSLVIPVVMFMISLLLWAGFCFCLVSTCEFRNECDAKSCVSEQDFFLPIQTDSDSIVWQERNDPDALPSELFVLDPFYELAAAQPDSAYPKCTFEELQNRLAAAGLPEIRLRYDRLAFVLTPYYSQAVTVNDRLPVLLLIETCNGGVRWYSGDRAMVKKECQGEIPDALFKYFKKENYFPTDKLEALIKLIDETVEEWEIKQ